MISKILIPLDGSSNSERILEHVSGLTRGLQPKVRLLTVADTSPEAEQQATRYLDAVLSRWNRRFRDIDVSLTSGDPAEEVVRTVLKGGFDLVAMTTHGRSGIRRVVLGSVAEKVLRSCPVPILMARPNLKPSRLRTLLIPLDGSHRAASVVPIAADLAALSGARALLFTVTPVQLPVSVASTNLMNLRNQMVDRKVETELVLRLGDPLTRILTAIRTERIDLVALSTHGRTGLARLRLGSVAESLLRRSPVPVLVLRTAGVPRKHRLLAPRRYARVRDILKLTR